MLDHAETNAVQRPQRQALERVKATYSLDSANKPYLTAQRHKWPIKRQNRPLIAHISTITFNRQLLFKHTDQIILYFM